MYPSPSSARARLRSRPTSHFLTKSISRSLPGEVVGEALGLRKTIARGAGEHHGNRALQADPVAGGNVDDVAAVARPQRGADLLVLVDERRPGAPFGRRL